MHYTNGELKIDQLVSYLNENKINLMPPFQRGRVWTIKLRSGLLKNIIGKKPIPAIFLYKEAAGSKYTYNILDGKQRIESIILFIKSHRKDLSIDRWKTYFFEKNQEDLKDFQVEVNGQKKAFTSLPSEIIRDLREYVIPTIEINMDDESDLQEIVSLFVDINQKGVKVEKFDIVKAIQRDNPLLKEVLSLIALEQKRGNDRFYKVKRTPFSKVLKKISKVGSLKENDAKVNFMWERLLELAVFAETSNHRKPVDILKMFISSKNANAVQVTKQNIRKLREVFNFLEKVCRRGLDKTKLVLDTTYFYTMVTTLLKHSDLIRKEPKLGEKLITVSSFIQKGSHPNAKQDSKLKHLMTLSAKRTTDTGNREDRGNLFLDLIHNC
jgi:hypothetical protein